MECLKLFRKRVGNNGVANASDLTRYEVGKEFKRMLTYDPCSIDLKITDVDEVNITENTKTVRVIVNDVSDNDQKSFDEKWLFIENEHNVHIGCYALFDDCIWLINFKEHNSIGAYKKFIMKKCNQIVKYKYDGVIYDIPVVAKNLTQYSDGLQDVVYTSMPDNKLSLAYGVNHITKNIKLGQRVMLNGTRVYRTTMVEDYQYNASYQKHDGIASAIVVFTPLRDTDDVENNLADNDDTVNVVGLNIVGSDKVMPGSKFKYGLSEARYTDWKIEYKGSKSNYVTLKRGDGVCTLDIRSDMDLIGESFKLISINGVNLPQCEKEISVTGF
ncbi:MAG: hypothetical protein ACRC18_07195 [Cetobacterium sp.]